MRQWQHAETVAMQYPAITLILEEHRALGAVLRALREAVDHARGDARAPDFELLRAMLFYMDDMPARLHHALESELLFPCIRERCPPLRPVLDRLEAEHGRGESAVQELERALTGWELMGEERREAFELQLRAYVQGYLGHMEVEENYVLPVAQDYLSAADWRQLETAFQGQRGALAEATLQGHRALLQRILTGNPAVAPACKTSKSPS
jgi:hemerythrin-like domain-containing protein